MKVAVVGATGMVGEVMLKVLEERNFPISELLLVASERSVGKKLTYKNDEYTVIGLADAVAAQPDIAIFSAGGDTSLEWAPKFAEVGTTVIDNSSAWRMDPTKKLVVPEINAGELTTEDKIIANPNCSTIQMVLAFQMAGGKTRQDFAAFKKLDAPWVASNNGSNAATLWTQRTETWVFDAFEDVIFASKSDFERAYAGNEDLIKAGNGLFGAKVLVVIVEEN